MFNVINLSRLQFAITAIYHFTFVSLTIGLSIIIAMLETIYVITNNKIYKNIVIFFGKIFSISFAIGVATGIIMELQFGTNWSNFSSYVGDIFGFPLVLEGIMAFFLESTLIGLFLFGWKRLSKIQHLIITWLIVIGSNLSALWIIIANAWMQNPVSYNFNVYKMRMEVGSFYKIFFNKTAQIKFFHTMMSCYCLGSIIALGISSYFILNNKYFNISKKIFTLSSIFGFFSIILTIILGDESGFEINNTQKTKLALIESEWETQKAPASFNLFCIPFKKYKKNYFSIKIPYLSGILITRSLNKKIIGLKEILEYNKSRIKNGIEALKLLDKIKSNNFLNIDIKKFNLYKKDIGFGFLFKKFFSDIYNVKDEEINYTSEKSIPNVIFLFFSFRIMVLCGFLILLLMILCLFKCLKNDFSKNIWIYKLCLFSIPLPFLAIQSGWFVSEYGRQPWIIYNLFPTYLGCSILNLKQVIFSIFSIIIIYIIIFILGIYLIFNLIKKGPKNF